MRAPGIAFKRGTVYAKTARWHHRRGRIGQVHAKSITYHIPQAEIVAISDLFPENAQKVADDLGIPKAVQDYHEILNDPTVDAVLICSSTDTHADIAVDCFQNTADTNSRVCMKQMKQMDRRQLRS